MAQFNRKETIGYLIQLFTVAFGISIPFLLNEWRENSRNLKLEQQTLMTIKDNLTTDTLQQTRQIEVAKIYIHNMQQLLENNPTQYKDSIDFYLDAMISYVAFKTTKIGYEEMVQTGTSRLIRDSKLRKSIITYYTTTNNYIIEWNNIDRKFVLEEAIIYYQKHFPYAPYGGYKEFYQKNPNAILRELQKDEFKNKVRENILFKQASLFVLNKSKAKAKEVIKEIDEYLVL